MARSFPRRTPPSPASPLHHSCDLETARFFTSELDVASVSALYRDISREAWIGSCQPKSRTGHIEAKEALRTSGWRSGVADCYSRSS